MSVDYLLHESSVGYAIFRVVHQADTVGNRLKEVQDSVQVYSGGQSAVVARNILIVIRILQSSGRWSNLSALHLSSKPLYTFG